MGEHRGGPQRASRCARLVVASALLVTVAATALEASPVALPSEADPEMVPAAPVRSSIRVARARFFGGLRATLGIPAGTSGTMLSVLP